VSEQELEELRKRYEAFARGDWDVAFEGLGPEFEMHDHGLLDVPVLRGPDAIREAQAKAADAFGETRFQPARLIDLDDRILALVRFFARGRGSGVELETKIGQLWTLKDGQAVRLDVYRTWEEAAKAAGYPSSVQVNDAQPG
jgi:ketosteroid isomerase-like protein